MREENLTLPAVNVLTSLFAGFYGFTFYAAPNFFYSPSSGRYPVLFNKTYLESDELDPITCFVLRCCGAEMCNICLTYFLFVKGTKSISYHRAHARNCLCAYVFSLPLCFSKALDSSGDFVRSTFAGHAAMIVLMIILTTKSLMESKDYGETAVENVDVYVHRANQIATVFMAVYAVPAYVAPNFFYGPNGLYPFFHTTTLDCNNLDPIQTFATRAMAASVSYHFLQHNFLDKHVPILANKINCMANILWLHPYMEQVRSVTSWGIQHVFLGKTALFLIVRYVQFRAAGAFNDGANMRGAKYA